MTNEQRYALATTVKDLKKNQGVPYSYFSKKLKCTSHAVNHFANGAISTLGYEKVNILNELTKTFLNTDSKHDRL